MLLLVKVRVTVVGPLGFGCVKVSFVGVGAPELFWGFRVFGILGIKVWVKYSLLLRDEVWHAGCVTSSVLESAYRI